jgi:hypothetical protein
MAQKRMFNKSVTNSDDFLELPDSSQVLYFHLSMNADDDGFVNNWKSIIRMTGTKEDDLKILIAKQFVIPFESGVIVIRHWRLNNYLQNDRTKPTIYQKELKQLDTDNNNVYSLYTECIHSIEENSIDKNSIDNTLNEFKVCNVFEKNYQCEDICKSTKERCQRRASYNINGKNYCNQHSRGLIPDFEVKQKKFEKPTIEEINKYCLERNNGINAEAFYDFYESKDWYVGKNKMKDWKACIRTWERRNEPKEEKLPSWWNDSEKELSDTNNELEELISKYE